MDQPFSKILLLTFVQGTSKMPYVRYTIHYTIHPWFIGFSKNEEHSNPIVYVGVDATC